MARKRTLEELEAAARRAEARARSLRAEMRKKTEAEKAREGTRILDAVKRWAAVQTPPIPWEGLVDFFTQQAAMKVGKGVVAEHETCGDDVPDGEASPVAQDSDAPSESVEDTPTTASSEVRGMAARMRMREMWGLDDTPAERDVGEA